MKKEIIRTEDAVGKILAHDITRIVKGEFKGSLFKKGHIIAPEDVDRLLDVGKSNIYVLQLSGSEVHEDEAGIRLGAAISGEGIYTQPPKESRVNLFAEHDGLLKINEEAVQEINDLHVEGLPKVEKLNALVGRYVNLAYPLPSGAAVNFLNDQTTYLGTQLKSEFGGERCFGVLAGMDFILISTYGPKGEAPELVLYKKR